MVVALLAIWLHVAEHVLAHPNHAIIEDDQEFPYCTYDKPTGSVAISLVSWEPTCVNDERLVHYGRLQQCQLMLAVRHRYDIYAFLTAPSSQLCNPSISVHEFANNTFNQNAWSWLNEYEEWLEPHVYNLTDFRNHLPFHVQIYYLGVTNDAFEGPLILQQCGLGFQVALPFDYVGTPTETVLYVECGWLTVSIKAECVTGCEYLRNIATTEASKPIPGNGASGITNSAQKPTKKPRPGNHGVQQRYDSGWNTVSFSLHPEIAWTVCAAEFLILLVVCTVLCKLVQRRKDERHTRKFYHDKRQSTDSQLSG